MIFGIQEQIFLRFLQNISQVTQVTTMMIKSSASKYRSQESLCPGIHNPLVAPKLYKNIHCFTSPRYITLFYPKRQQDNLFSRIPC